MQPSQLLLEAIAGNQAAAQELGRLLDSLTPLYGPGAVLDPLFYRSGVEVLRTPGSLALGGSIKESTALGARVRNTTGAVVATGTTTFLTFDTETFDTDLIHDTVTNPGRLTCKTAGVYYCALQVAFPTNATGVRQAGITLNAARTIQAMTAFAPPAASDVPILNCSCIINMAVNDYIEARVVQTSGGDLTLTVTQNFSPEFMMVRIA